MSALKYAREKFDLAVSNMAISDGSPRDRVFSAWITIHTVKPDAFNASEDLRFAWADLQAMMKSAETGTNSLERGLRKIEDAEVRRLAEQIVLVASLLRHHSD